jgi:integrase
MPLTLVPPRKGRSANYTVRGRVRVGNKVSKPINETTGIADFELAEAFRAKLQAKIQEELLFGARASVRFADAAVMYLEKVRPGSRHRDAINGYRRKDGTVGPNLIDDIGDRLVSEIDQNTIDEIVEKRFRDAKPGTIVRGLIGPLSQVLNFAARRKWCDSPKFERPKFDDRRSRWARPDEVVRLLAASHRLRPLIVFLLLSGARLSEALRLDWDDVDLSARWMVFRNTKRKKRGEDQPGEDRGVPIHPQLVTELANLPGERTGAVFKSHLGKAYAVAQRQGGGQIKTGWAMTLRRAGIADLRVHDLRHTFATRLWQTGCDEQLRDEIMGHASTRMGRRYAHVPRPELIAAIDRLPPLDLPPAQFEPVENTWRHSAVE